MNPYFTFVKKQHIRALAFSPLQVFLLFSEPGKKGNKRELQIFAQLLKNNNWYKSKFMKFIIRMTKKLYVPFEKAYLNEIPPANFPQLKNTIYFLEHFLSEREIKELLNDYLSLAGAISDFLIYKSESEDKKEDYESTLEDLEDFFDKFPTTSPQLAELLVELPFQVFLLVAKADGRIDSKEGNQYLKILRDPEWCQSECSRLILVGSSYYFKEQFASYKRGKVEGEFKQVKRTLKLSERIFKKDQLKFVKTDLQQLAYEIARASGGIAGFGSISRKEKKVLEQLNLILGVKIPRKAK